MGITERIITRAVWKTWRKMEITLSTGMNKGDWGETFKNSDCKCLNHITMLQQLQVLAQWQSKWKKARIFAFRLFKHNLEVPFGDEDYLVLQRQDSSCCFPMRFTVTIGFRRMLPRNIRFLPREVQQTHEISSLFVLPFPALFCKYWILLMVLWLCCVDGSFVSSGTSWFQQKWTFEMLGVANTLKSNKRSNCCPLVKMNWWTRLPIGVTFRKRKHQVAALAWAKLWWCNVTPFSQRQLQEEWDSNFQVLIRF